MATTTSPGLTEPPTYGAVHASRGLTDAVLSYLPQAVAVYARPISLGLARQHVQSIVQRLSPGGAGRWVQPTSSLVQDWSDHRLALWFNPAGDISSFPHFRSAIGSSDVPIVSVHHTISYRMYLQARFLMLLFARPRSFDAIVCTSGAAKQAVQNAIRQTSESLAKAFGINASFKGKLPILPLAVDTERFSPREKDASRSELGLNNQDFIVLFLGRVSPIDKGDLLPCLQALCRLPVVALHRLVIVLAGRQEPEAASELKGFVDRNRSGLRLDVRGVVPEQMKPTLYSAADVFISPADSVQEMFGLAPLEAMACGVPQIVPDWDGYRDTVVDGETGFLIPTVWAPCSAELDILSLFDSTDWRETHFNLGQSVAIDYDCFILRLKQTMEDHKLRARMSAASRQRAVDRFSWPVVARQYSELFDALIEEAKASAEKSEMGADRRFSQPSYFELFHHFTSKNLSPSTVLRGSSVRFQDSIWAARLPYVGSRDLDRGVIKLIAETFDTGHRETTVRQVIDACQASDPSLTSSLALRHLMWLLKYGFITV